MRIRSPDCVTKVANRAAAPRRTSPRSSRASTRAGARSCETPALALNKTNNMPGRTHIPLMQKPLRNIRVLDLTNVLAGPFCCHQLAHMGAEVIKVETPGTGDLARQLGADPKLNRRLMGASFLAQNAGKRSITLNLKNANAREAFARLVKT